MNLSDMPTDLIDTILHMDEHSLRSARLISSSWNAAASSYLKEPRHKIALNNLILFTVPSRTLVSIPNDIVEREADQGVAMSAKFSKRASWRICRGHWLKFDYIRNEVLHVQSDPHKFSISEDDEIGNRFSYRFRRFFDSFSRIETLTLKGFPDWRVLTAALDMMGVLRVRKLVISNECNFDVRSMRQILEAIRRHKIALINVYGDYLTNEKWFTSDEFIQEAIRLGARFEAYESADCERRYFEISRAMWAEKARQWSGKGVSMQLTFRDQTISSDSFLSNHTFGTHAVLSVMSTEQRKSIVK